MSLGILESENLHQFFDRRTTCLNLANMNLVEVDYFRVLNSKIQMMVPLHQHIVPYEANLFMHVK